MDKPVHFGDMFSNKLIYGRFWSLSECDQQNNKSTEASRLNLLDEMRNTWLVILFAAAASFELIQSSCQKSLEMESCGIKSKLFCAYFYIPEMSQR